MDRAELKLALAEVLAEFEADKDLPIEVRRIRLEPGDTVVLKTARTLSEHAARCISFSLAQAFPGVKVVVLDAGMDLEVCSPSLEAQPPRPPMVNGEVTQ